MSYTQPNTYINGNVVEASDQNENDDVARIAINQGTVTADIDSNVFDYDSIQRGEYEAVTQSHQFTTGDVYGEFSDRLITDRSYFTSETKANDQVDSVQYQDVYHTGCQFKLETGGHMMYTFGGNFVSDENISAASPPYNDGSHPGRGTWDSTIYLRFTDKQANTTSYLAGTLSYSYEETGGGPSGSTNPGGQGVQARRWVGFQWMIKNLNPGTYEVCVVVNPKVERGHCNARQFTCETFLT